MKIKLSNVRLSFPSLHRKAVFQGEETKFEATFLLDKTEDANIIKIINEEIEKGVKTEFKTKKLPPDKICLRDGDDVEYDGYAGCMALKASSKKRPLLLDARKKSVEESDNLFYAGCYVNAIVELWFQNNQYGKRVNATLLGVQFVRDGKPFGSGSSASEDDFEMEEADDENLFD